MTHEFFQVVQHNPVEPNQIAVDVIEDFDFRGLGP